MTAQATRDALAEMDGWRLDTPTDRTHPAALWWRWNDAHVLKSRTWCRTHPHPPTLDGAHAAITAAGWKWERYTSVWLAWRGAGITVEVPDTGDPVNDLWTLALACRKAMEEKR